MKNIQQSVCMPMTEKVLNSLGMHRIPLPEGTNAVEMNRQFMNAPQFSKIDLGKALQLHRGKLRVILVGEETYCKRQCAMYLATMANELVQSEECSLPTEKQWTSMNNDEEEDVNHSLSVLPDTLVDPKCSNDPAECVTFPLTELTSMGAIVEGTGNNILTEWAATAFIHLMVDDELPHLFLSVKSEQISTELSKELQLHYGFAICHVGMPTDTYLQEVFWTQAEIYYPNIRENSAVDGKEVVKHLKHLRGKQFSQRDMESCVKRTLPLNLTANMLKTENFTFSPTALVETASGREELESMTELEQVKAVVERLLAMDKLNLLRHDKGLKIEPRHRHMAFDGAPGTGKTVTAQILAKILHEEGMGSGIFVEVGKEDMVGRYLGHTAPKIANLFKKARGGVLFLDEIGSLVIKNEGSSDNYTEEAINTLVYHMDRNPETVVIFATYPDEMDTFLEANAGLSSRVAQRINFPSYGKNSLLQILTTLCEKQGYTLDKRAVTICGNYLQKERELSPNTFGNAREVRRIFNAVEEELALRITKDGSSDFTLTSKDMKTAIARLETKNKQGKRTIGFAV